MAGERASRGLGGTSAALGAAAGVAGAANPIAGAVVGLGAGLLSIFGAIQGRRQRRAEDQFLETQRGAQQRQAMSMASGMGLTPGATVRAAGSVAGNLEAASAPAVAQMGIARAQRADQRRLAIFTGLGNALSSAGALGIAAGGGQPQPAQTTPQAALGQTSGRVGQAMQDPTGIRPGPMNPTPSPTGGEEDALLTLQLLDEIMRTGQQSQAPTADPLGPMQGPYGGMGLTPSDQQYLLQLLGRR